MPSVPSIARPRIHAWAVCAALFTGTVLLFSRAAGYGFLNYDDPIFVSQNLHVQQGLTWDSVAWAFVGRADYWQPLTWISHMLDWRLYGDRAAGHHVTSVLWHAANAVLVFLVMRRLTGAFWTSAFGAALFAWHPLRVESVVWITERKDVMSGFFFLLTLWAYASYSERRRDSRRAWSLYLLTLGLFLGGLMCKPMLVTLPCVLLILDFWPLRRGRESWRALLVEKIPFFALSILVSWITVDMQSRDTGFVLALPLGARLGNAVVSVVRYMGNLLWPFDLTAIYPHPGYWPAWIVVAAALVVVALTAAAWCLRAARPWILAGWAWFLVMLLPVIGLVQVGFQAKADRYTYLPILGLQLALLWTLREGAFWRARPWAARALAAALLLGCAARTWDQEDTWRDSQALFRHAIAVTGRNDTAHGLLAYTLVGLGKLDEGALESRRALEINPRNEPALTALAAVQEQQGRVDDAIATCRAVLLLNPLNAEIEFSLGLLLLREDKTDEAGAHLRSAVARRPRMAALNRERAAEETARHRPRDAFLRYAAALELNRSDAAAYVGLGLSLTQMGRPDEALASYESAAQIQPDNPDAQRGWADGLARKGQFADALPHYARAVQLRPADPGGYAALGYALLLSGRRSEAMDQWEQALKLDPHFPGLRERLHEVSAEGPSASDAR
jgi:protein O-mannosyl-transferase